MIWGGSKKEREGSKSVRKIKKEAKTSNARPSSFFASSFVFHCFLILHSFSSNVLREPDF
jgi:hypothetical protein